MKRFWDQAAAAPAEDGFAVLLDGRPLRLPGSGPLRLPLRPLAEAVAEEWQAAGGARGGEMSMEEVPLTRVVATALERMAPDPAPSAAAIAHYGQADLLCYRGTDARLAARQAQEWQPLLDWAALAFDAPLRVTSGVMPVAQPPETARALHAAVAVLPVLPLAALGVAVPALGSLVLGLAMAHGRLDAAEACRLAFLDETFQQELWGQDQEALERQRGIVKDVALAERLLILARG
ncbi:chaperone, ATP12 [Pseudoroseomonas rhizosphaerae]|uniref:Chaperone, ATP12 n=1 Tax=Teichococcus rhizosphaerae TaxID=1335062 RepID=A0A2C6Z884_9PROT|nr:ATP12 family protein [Pseudoroseomonas rhizosphaerae]PHK94711.1 chaperone, ATP12 [Pseudoroseomonas rhizosphaerae]